MNLLSFFLLYLSISLSLNSDFQAKLPDYRAVDDEGWLLQIIISRYSAIFTIRFRVKMLSSQLLFRWFYYLECKLWKTQQFLGSTESWNIKICNWWFNFIEKNFFWSFILWWKINGNCESLNAVFKNNSLTLWLLNSYN